jgi:hypothetical protein
MTRLPPFIDILRNPDGLTAVVAAGDADAGDRASSDQRGLRGSDGRSRPLSARATLTRTSRPRECTASRDAESGWVRSLTIRRAVPEITPSEAVHPFQKGDAGARPSSRSAATSIDTMRAPDGPTRLTGSSHRGSVPIVDAVHDRVMPTMSISNSPSRGTPRPGLSCACRGTMVYGAKEALTTSSPSMPATGRGRGRSRGSQAGSCRPPSYRAVRPLFDASGPRLLVRRGWVGLSCGRGPTSLVPPRADYVRPWGGHLRARRVRDRLHE